jgi:hypothetical protein
MKWVHPKAVMLAKIRGEKTICDTCFHDGGFNTRGRKRDGMFWCGKRLEDPNPRGGMNDLKQVCRHWRPK